MSNHLIDYFEGQSLTAYKCPAGVWTIGKGLTHYQDGSPVKPGDTIDEKQAEELLEYTLEKEVRPIFKEIPYTLTHDMKIALESLIFNIGISSFRKSKLFYAIKEKDLENIFKQWDWIKGGGKVLSGLVKRRSQELALFLKDL